MKQILISIISLSLLAFAPGCVTSKVAQISPTGTTNYVTVVNQSNLELDSAVLQSVTAVAVATAITQTHNDPGVIAALKNAQMALNGILSGSNQQTTDQVLALLKAQGNQVLSAQVTALVSAVSAKEQELLQTYGQTVSGQITTEILKAINAGLVVGLAGH